MNKKDEFLLQPQRIGEYFQRHKVSRKNKAEAARLYLEGLSLSVIARRFNVTKEAVRQWMLKFESYFASRQLSRRKGEANHSAGRDQGEEEEREDRLRLRLSRPHQKRGRLGHIIQVSGDHQHGRHREERARTIQEQTDLHR
jgi:transposase-like protein